MNEFKRDISNIGLLGGRLSIDFTNTVDWRGISQPIEFINNYRDFVAWCQRVHVVDDRETNRLLETAKTQAEQSDSVYKRVIALREALYRIFCSIHKGKPDPADLAVFNQELSSAMASSRVMPAATGFYWKWAGAENQLDRILWPVVHDAALLLTSDLLDRVGMCSDEKCGWLFLDTSKNHKRRWCSMNDCGNRAKVLRHYRRNRPGNSKKE